MQEVYWQKRAICNVLEYQSRYCLASLVCPNETSLTACDALSAALAEAKKLGLPITKIEVKSDHGAVFTAEAFETFITDQGNWHTLSAVGRPQGMGRVERYNRNSKEQRLRWTDIQEADELQTELSSYRKFYNEERPHRALGGLTPIAFCARLAIYRYRQFDGLHTSLQLTFETTSMSFLASLPTLIN